MKPLYTKTLLFTYPHLSQRIKTIEEKSIRIGFNSFHSKTMECIERLIDLYDEKKLYLKLLRVLNLIQSRLSNSDVQLLEYKYFRSSETEIPEGFDYTSRSYFRKQQKVLKHLCNYLDLCGLTDEFFEKECLRFNFMSSMLLVTEDHEKKQCNKFRSNYERNN